MRALCFMLTLVVLILSVRPCCDDRYCESSLEQSGKQASDQKQCPGCSPFFSCGSCVGFIVEKPHAYITQCVTEKPQQAYTPYIHPQIKDVSLAIWQPPQLG